MCRAESVILVLRLWWGWTSELSNRRIPRKMMRMDDSERYERCGVERTPPTKRAVHTYSALIKTTLQAIKIQSQY